MITEIEVYGYSGLIYKTKSRDIIENTSIMSFLSDIYFGMYSKWYWDIEFLCGAYSFIKTDGTRIKGQLGFGLQDFINNFGIPTNPVKLYFCDGYGKGAAYNIKEVARIQLNGNEPEHLYEPHVHVFPIGTHLNCVRIRLKDLKQMEGDKIKFNKLFKKRKSRKAIIDSLRTNKTDLENYYYRITRGEAIENSEMVVTVGGELVCLK